MGEELADFMELTASQGSFNFQGRVLKLSVDRSLREKDRTKAMGALASEPAAPQGGTFSSGSGAVLPRNLHGNAETIVSFTGFHGQDSPMDGCRLCSDLVDSPKR